MPLYNTPMDDLAKIVDAFNKANNEMIKKEQKDKFIEYITNNTTSLTEKPPAWTGANNNTFNHGLARIVSSDFKTKCNKNIEPKIKTKIKSIDCNNYCTSETNTIAYGPQLFKIKQFILNNPEIYEKYKELYSDFFVNENLNIDDNCVNNKNANGNCLLPIDFANLCNEEIANDMSSYKKPGIMNSIKQTTGSLKKSIQNMFTNSNIDKQENNVGDKEPDWIVHYEYKDDEGKKSVNEMEKKRNEEIEKYLKKNPDKNPYGITKKSIFTRLLGKGGKQNTKKNKKSRKSHKKSRRTHKKTKTTHKK